MGLALLLSGTSAVAGELPAEPDVAVIHDQIGVPGGELRTLVGSNRDTRLLAVYGYARLVGYDRQLELAPDILGSLEVEDERVFTFGLRRGHRWSDGVPFTAEDFRYYWEDVANNVDLSPTGPSHLLLVDGELPTVEIIDDLTIRYSWSKPNPFFLPALAGARPLFIYRPAHYLRAFHERYADPAEIERIVAAEQARDWAQVHGRRDRMYRFDNPDLPTLQPWVLQTRPPAVRFVAERNPYYYRIDPEGQQLPYIDRFILEVVDGRLIPIKTGAGETDLQARGLFFKDYTFLKASEEHNDLDTRRWRSARGAHLALYPNLNASDPAWRELFRDARFRRALSLGVDRHEINQVLYFGLALEGNNSVLPESSLYREPYRYAWTDFDLDAANQLLDEMGLAEHDSKGLRLLPDGRPMNLIIETAGEESEQTDVLELIHDGWLKLGIKTFTKPLQREVLRNRIFSGETLMTVWFGIENGIPSANMSPEEFVPSSQQQYQWPRWGQYFQTKGQAGEPPDMAEPKRLLDLYGKWQNAGSTETREGIWREILEIYSDQVFSIGLIGGVPQPIAVNDRLRNVPEEGIYNWEPGAHFGIYRPDTFWWASGTD